jgi:hypothetical protein
MGPEYSSKELEDRATILSLSGPFVLGIKLVYC